MDDLVQWLRAQLDVDAEQAVAAGGDDWRRQDHPSDTVAVYDSKGEPVVYDEGWPTVEQQAHIAEHDPARVLREIEADRVLLTEYDRLKYDVMPDDMTGVVALENVVRAKAAVYADRPGYQESWRP